MKVDKYEYSGVEIGYLYASAGDRPRWRGRCLKVFN